jgi:hypothetical protein
MASRLITSKQVDVGEIWYENVNWIQLVHMMVEWLDFMNT